MTVSATRRRRRAAALRALANDPAATNDERELAAKRAAELHTDAGEYVETEVEIGDERVARLDHQMAKAMTVKADVYRRARVRAVQHEFGADVVKKWCESRGLALPR